MAMGKTDLQQQTKAKKKDQDNLPTKVVIRRLPPTLTEEKLKQELDGIPEYDYLRLVPPDYSLAPHVFCRAYINFKSFENVLQFRNAYDGYIFNEGKGCEYSAVVELTSYHGIPKENKKRKDLKSGTIYKDPDYEAFLENFSKKVEPLPSAEVYIEAMESVKAEKDSGVKPLTPLVEFLNKKRALRKSAAAMAENERKLKREKDNLKDFSKGSKMDQKSVTKDGRKERPDSSTKALQDRRAHESRRKEERKDRKVAAGRKSRNEREIRDNKDLRKDSKKDTGDRPSSARSDSSKHFDERTSKREDRRHKDDRRDKDKRRTGESKETGFSKVLEEPKKFSRPDAVKDEHHRERRKSIEHEDPSIVAFGKTVTTNKDSNSFGSKRSEDRNGTDEQRSKDRERYRENRRDQHDEIDKRTKNKDRPSMAVYRPPVARQDRGKSKEERPSGDKYRVKSPENSRSPEKRERASERGYERDRPRPRSKQTNPEKDGDVELNRTVAKPKDKDREQNRNHEKEFKGREKDNRKEKDR